MSQDGTLTFVAETVPEGGFIAWALGHSIFTQAATVNDLHHMIEDAVRCHFDNDELPWRVQIRFAHGEDAPL